MKRPSRFSLALVVSAFAFASAYPAEPVPTKPHWAFVKPVRPSLPKVKDKAWTKNEIDAFILACLKSAGLKPSPPADKTTLIRRLSFDLRGLPPTLQEVDEFLADRGPDAYEKLVDRMLASARYGEKMALLWLDLARFGDTSGYENDSIRQMWMWRDWVIAAFNKNIPFDQFTIEQLAGDLLPNATTEQRIASGFNRNTRFNEEAGSDPEEFAIRYNVDRTNTFGQVWLGATLGCAECHDHKYDPFSQKEFYQLYAYFTGIKEPFLSGNHNVPLPPILKRPSAEQAREMERLEKDQARAQAAIDKMLATLSYRDPLEDKPDAAKATNKPQDIVWLEDGLPPGARLESLENFREGSGIGSWKWDVARRHPVFGGERSLKGSGSGLFEYRFTDVAKPLFVSPGDKLFINVYLDPKKPPQSIMLTFFDGDGEHRVYWGSRQVPPRANRMGRGISMLGHFPKRANGFAWRSKPTS